MTAQPSGPQPSRLAGQLATTLGFLLFLAGCVMSSFAGVTLVFLTDSCGTVGECNTELIVVGMVLTALGPWVVFAITAIGYLARVRRERTGTWIPWVGFVLAAGVVAAGVALAFAGVP